MWRPTSLIALGLVLGIAACGGGGSGNAASPEEAVKETLDNLVTGVEKRDYAMLCEEVLDAKLTRNLGQVGETCDSALKQAFDQVRSPRLEVEDIDVDGERATARVRTAAAGQQSSTDTVELVKVKDVGWRITSLAS